MSEAAADSASPKDDVPSQQQPEVDVKMEYASEDEAAKEIKLEEELFATDSEDDEFPGKGGPDTPPSSDEDKNSQPTSSYAFFPKPLPLHPPSAGHAFLCAQKGKYSANGKGTETRRMGTGRRVIPRSCGPSTSAFSLGGTFSSG